MKKLKIILLFSILIIRIPFILDVKSKYTDETKIEGIINYYQIDGDKLSLEIIGKEKILANYYFKTEEEKKYYEENIELGFLITATGTLKEPSSNRNFNLFNYKKYLKSKKIYWIFEIDNFNLKKDNQIRYKIKNQLIHMIGNNENADYLKMFILGENNLDNDIKQTFQFNGINHLFAISGMHITVLTSLILFILNKLFHNKLENFILVCIFLLFYMFLTNYTPSVIRASLFFVLLNLKQILKWKISNFILLLFLLILLINDNPYYIYNIGFLYSFVISLGLTYFNNKLNSNNYIKTTFKISFIAFLLSLPINILVSNQINFLSPFINVLFVPLVTFIIFPFSLINFIIPFISPITQLLFKLLENISLILSKITFFTIVVKTPPIYFIILYYLIIIWVIKKLSFKRVLLLIFLLLLHSNINNFRKYPILTMIDVGQGDSVLIELPNNKIVLVDTGGTMTYKDEEWQKRRNQYSLANSIIIPYLKSRGIKKIDYLILTHGDYDHMGEAINLVNNFKVEKIIFNCGGYNDLEQELIKVLDKKKIKYYSCIKQLNIDNNNLYFLNNGDYDNENNNSNVIYTELNNYKLLLMGDASVEVEEDLIEKYNLQDIDILKVGHHGSKTSSSNEFINEVNPKYSIISVGKNNRYGHPNDEVLDNLKYSKIYRTDQNGSIMFKIKNDKLEIEVCIS